VLGEVTPRDPAQSRHAIVALGVGRLGLAERVQPVRSHSSLDFHGQESVGLVDIQASGFAEAEGTRSAAGVPRPWRMALATRRSEDHKP